MLTRKPRLTSPRVDPDGSPSPAFPIWAVCGVLLALALVIGELHLIEPYATPILGALLIYAGAILIKRADDEP